MGVPEAAIFDAPKAEWHHDLRNGREVWFYDPAKVWTWWQAKRRKSEIIASAEAVEKAAFRTLEVENYPLMWEDASDSLRHAHYARARASQNAGDEPRAASHH